MLRAHGRPQAVVALLHGLAPDSGEQLEPWQVHLAEQGYDVIFPPARRAIWARIDRLIAKTASDR